MDCTWWVIKVLDRERWVYELDDNDNDDDDDDDNNDDDTNEEKW